MCISRTSSIGVLLFLPVFEAALPVPGKSAGLTQAREAKSSQIQSEAMQPDRAR